MTNSPLVTYTQISPNRNSPRNHAIDTITLHCTAGGSTLQGIGTEFDGKHGEKSANYCVDKTGKIGLYVPESDRSWASSNRENDNRAITIELMSEATPPYRITEACAKACVGLLVDICTRNGIPRLLWENNRSLVGKIDQQNMTLHRWFTSTDCPGEYIISIIPNIVREVNARLNPQPDESSTVHIKCDNAFFAEGIAAALRALGLDASI